MNKDYKKQVEKMNAEFRDTELQQLEKNIPIFIFFRFFCKLGVVTK